MKGTTPFQMFKVVTSFDATPFKQNNANPNGGVKNDVCKLTPIITPSQMALTFAPGSANNIGAMIGTTTTAISMKSRKNAFAILNVE